MVKCIDPHFVDAVGGALACDVVVNNQLALHNTALLRAYVAAFPAARPLCVLVKAWAARRDLNKARVRVRVRIRFRVRVRVG